MFKDVSKKIILSFMVVLSVLGLVGPFDILDIALAEELSEEWNSDTEDASVYYLTEEEIEAEHERQLQTYFDETSENQNLRCATCNETRSVLLRTRTVQSGWQIAGNQLKGGHTFNTRGSGFMFSANGGGNFSVSLGVGFGPASVSISRGNANSGVNGKLEIVPNHLIGRPVLLYVNHSIEIREYRIYERPRAMPHVPWKFVRVAHTTSVAHRATTVRRVN